jgi:hypothetical protein
MGWLNVPDAQSITVADYDCYLGQPHDVTTAWHNDPAYCKTCSRRMWLDTHLGWFGMRRAYRIEEEPR